MTMRCWMHWFWITALVLLSSSVYSWPLIKSETGSDHLVTPNVQVTTTTSTPIQQPLQNETMTTTFKEIRIGKAIDISPPVGQSYLAIGVKNDPYDLDRSNQTYQTSLKKQISKENSSNDDNKVDLSLQYAKIIKINPSLPEQQTNLTTITTMIEHITEETVKSLITNQQDVSAHENNQSRKERPDESKISASSISDHNEEESSSLSAAAITGTTFGLLVICGGIGALGLILYRRRYINHPQSLNDKCSNLDSTGYIDDNTIRENSEEMYSLDNDSFLNSLEAMTIQNYWTDSVKHTKL